MPYELVKTQSLAISSVNREAGETAYDFSVNIDSSCFQCKPDECFRVSVQSFACQYLWYNTKPGAQLINFTNTVSNVTTTVTIPEGSNF